MCACYKNFSMSLPLTIFFLRSPCLPPSLHLSHTFSIFPFLPHSTSSQVFPIQPSDVIITNIQNNARGELEFVMYIQVAGGAQVLAVEVLESAVQVNMVLYCPYCI